VNASGIRGVHEYQHFLHLPYLKLMHTIAIMSDLHANLPALHAVLEDIDKKQPVAVFCLGDLVDFAPWPNQVIETIRQSRIPTIMGNHDECIAFDRAILPLEKHTKEERAARVHAIEFTPRTITADHREYLAGLPRTVRICHGTGSRARKILLVHASPRSIDEYIYADHPETNLTKMLRNNDADVIVMGHTHLPYIRPLRAGRFAINTGSVGRSKEDRISAAYLMLTIAQSGIRPEIVRVAYPVEETARGIRESGIPDFYADFLAERTTSRGAQKRRAKRRSVMTA
jgi:predicted phosphodiesterase